MTALRSAPNGSAPHRSVPPIAWQCPIGVPPASPGRSRVLHEPLIDDGPWGGVPLGGMGAGSIGRTPRGDFARWHLDVGVHRFESIPACQFSVYTRSAGASEAHVLSTIRPTTLASWNWDLPPGAGRYHGLFPGAWFEYVWERLPVRLVGHQFSPVIPHDDRSSALPVGLFSWDVANPGSEPVTVGLMFSWQNLVGRGAGQDLRGGHRNLAVRRDGRAGIVLAGPDAARGEPWFGSFAIAAPEEPGLVVTTTSRFDADDGRDVWADFAADGRLDDVDDPTPAEPGRAIAAAVAVTCTLEPGEHRTIRFALAWDFPLATFGEGRRWPRRHTRWFGTSGLAAWDIAAEGLAREAEWRDRIERWQAPILADPGRPAWYRAALFNELYMLVDGGTFWADAEADGRAVDGPGPFALLECFDYPFYNTLDVYFYASFALIHLWPDLARRVVRDFVATVDVDDPEVVPVYATGGSARRKVAGMLPHDVGGPGEDPFVKLNHYHLQDVNAWKDLNAKFVLLVWQAVELLGDDALGRQAWPAVAKAMRSLASFDRDGDGLPEHDGVPDQTYDTWPMRGPSAYGGSLWLAALAATARLAERAGDQEHVAWARDLLDRATAAFERRLWAGDHYRYDAGGGPSSDSIMADQLAGQWWADATRLGDLVAADRVELALRTIHARNVRGFADGRMGAVNGTRPDGTVDASAEQSQEVWIGTTWALAAFMLGRGLADEAWETAAGAHRVIGEYGYRFRTPEAYDVHGDFRATMYLRPLAIWAIEHALRGTRA